MNVMVLSSNTPMAHRPRSNPFLRSSSVAWPFPCITPSTVTCVMVDSFMIKILSRWFVVVRSDRAAAPISSVVARSVLQSQREVRFGTPLLGQEAVSATDLPHVAVGIGERADVSPFLVSGFDGELSSGLLGSAHQFVYLGLGGQPDHDQTLVRALGRSFTIADHPAEASPGDQHQP